MTKLLEKTQHLKCNSPLSEGRRCSFEKSLRLKKHESLVFLTLWLAVLHSAKNPLKMSTVVDYTITKLIPAYQ